MAGVTQHLSLADLGEWAENMAQEFAGQSYREPLEVCRVLGRASVLENFATGKAPDGTPWPDLAHPRPNSKGSDQPLRDNGLLMAASTGGTSYSEVLTDTELVMSNNLEYAALHQFGGTILPRNARMLSIPMTVEAQRAGSPRDFPRRLFIYRNDEDSLPMLAESDEEGGLVVHYILVHSVTVPARPFMGWKPTDVEKIGLIFGEWAERTMQ
jgi:phage gpG-like protein